MLTLLKNAHVYSPRDLGVCDVLISGQKIIKVGHDLHLESQSISVDTFDANGLMLTPGFVDTLVHVTGGGGEGGFGSRTPELNVKDAINAGVTTVVGALGTDANTRTLRELYGKTQSLNTEGITCFMYTGSYELPIKTLMGDIKDDIIFIEPIIGVGEVAIADDRGAQASSQELARIASQARVGGLIAGKKGIVMIHVGDGSTHLKVLHQVAENFDVKIHQFYPTHINRNKHLLDAGIKFAKLGGTIDLTASITDTLITSGELRASQALAIALDAGVPLERITISSDAQGSLPHFDSNGVLDGLEIGRIDSLIQEFKFAVEREHVPLSSALAAITLNPANITGLFKKGRIAENTDADINLIDKNTFEIDSVIAKGKWLKKEGTVIAKTAFDHKD